jgi:hypothetical protein
MLVLRLIVNNMTIILPRTNYPEKVADKSSYIENTLPPSLGAKAVLKKPKAYYNISASLTHTFA